MQEETIKLAIGFKIREENNSEDGLAVYKEMITKSIIAAITEQELIQFKIDKDNGSIEGYIHIGEQTLPNYFIETQYILAKGTTTVSRNTEDKIILSLADSQKIDLSDVAKLEKLGWIINENSIERPKRKDGLFWLLFGFGLVISRLLVGNL